MPVQLNTVPKKEIAFKHATQLSTYLLIVWGMYRLLFKFPDTVDELFAKPLLWLVPVYYFVNKEKLDLSSLGFTLKKLFPSIYLAIALGAGFAIEGIIVNFIKYQNLDFSANIGGNPFFAAIGISLITSITEEVTFRGFIFNRYLHVFKNEWQANILTSIFWGLVHIPIAIFWWKLSIGTALGYLILTIIYGIGASFLFARTRNIASPILLHLFWEWPIILFR